MKNILRICLLLVFALVTSDALSSDCYKIDRSRPEWTDSNTVSVEDGIMIENMSIRLAAPNPFDNAINIEYELPHPDNVTITIIGLNGRKIKTLTDRFHEAGRFQVEWDGKSDDGSPRQPGVYILRLETSNKLESVKIILVK